jgi:hypothetical protein
MEWSERSRDRAGEEVTGKEGINGRSLSHIIDTPLFKY